MDHGVLRLVTVVVTKARWVVVGGGRAYCAAAEPEMSLAHSCNCAHVVSDAGEIAGKLVDKRCKKVSSCAAS